MSDFKLDSDVPMPTHRNRYPFDSMAKGQSFVIVGEAESRKVRNAAYQYAKKVNTAIEEAKTKGEDVSALSEVKFALRKASETSHPALNEDGTPKVDAEGKPLTETVKSYRLWRE